MSKQIHVKPSLYAYYFIQLKEIALNYGYNLVLHGSMNRDLDLIAIAWQEQVKPHEDMVAEFCTAIGGYILTNDRRAENGDLISDLYSVTHHDRIQYVINVNRGRKFSSEDPQYYLDISVIAPKIK